MKPFNNVMEQLKIHKVLIPNTLGEHYQFEQLYRYLPQDEQRVQDFCQANPDYFQMTEGRLPHPDLAKELFDEIPPRYDVETKFMVGVVQETEQKLCALIDLLPNFPNQSTWALGLLLVEQNLRSTGLGASIYRALEQLIANLGIRKIRLGVVEQNKRGMHFWQKMGFQPTGITKKMMLGTQENTVFVFDKKIKK